MPFLSDENLDGEKTQYWRGFPAI